MSSLYVFSASGCRYAFCQKLASRLRGSGFEGNLYQQPCMSKPRFLETFAGCLKYKRVISYHAWLCGDGLPNLETGTYLWITCRQIIFGLEVKNNLNIWFLRTSWFEGFFICFLISYSRVSTSYHRSLPMY